MGQWKSKSWNWETRKVLSKDSKYEWPAATNMNQSYYVFFQSLHWSFWPAYLFLGCLSFFLFNPIMMSMEYDYRNAVFVCLRTVTNALTFVVFLLIYVAYHAMFYSVVETSLLYIKSIMTVWLISVQSQICVGHILNMIITSWGAS